MILKYKIKFLIIRNYIFKISDAKGVYIVSNKKQAKSYRYFNLKYPMKLREK